jgi:ABC-type nitrate/sulfonate/bicarbonate transport system permease component
LIVLLAWELSSRFALINPYFFPEPLKIALVAIDLARTGALLTQAGATFLRAMAAIALSVVVGVPLGILVARVRPVRWFFDPLISFGFPIPKITLWPIFVLWFGFHDVSKILLTAFACVLPILSATQLATADVDKYLLWSARNMGTSEYKLLWKVIFRAAFPGILTGVQTALPVAFIVTVLTEMLSGGVGLGAMVMLAGQLADMPTLFVGIIAASLLGYCTMRAVEALRHHLLIWHEETAAHS